MVFSHAKRIPFYEIDKVLEQKVNIWERKDVNQDTERIRRKIEQVNKRLTEEENDVLIGNAAEENPEGYDCENQIMEIKEVNFVDQVRCYNTTEEICSMVRSVQFFIVFVQF